MNRSWLSHDEDETMAAGREIAPLLPPDAVVHLVGDLGAGKTTLARAIATALGANPLEVSSPSFAIIHEYPLPDGPSIIHIDGYRLSGQLHEWEEIGIPEILRGEGIKLIEWPRHGFEAFGRHNVTIEIRMGGDESREIRMSSES
ncbi:MAG: tRNA (adenosine(37)-N6)-threonylcarbamoyltransferase complex ATPase subunit type 1 TsaE [Thermoanaerobaculia bacterium]